MSPYDVMTAEGVTLATWAKGRKFGSITVVDATPSIDTDSRGRTAVYLDLTLADPADGEETWPINDVLALHREVDDKARTVLTTDVWHVRLHAETPDLVAEEDEAEQPW